MTKGAHRWPEPLVTCPETQEKVQEHSGNNGHVGTLRPLREQGTPADASVLCLRVFPETAVPRPTCFIFLIVKPF